jgi:hypothetical protein
MGFDTKNYSLTDCQPQYDFDFELNQLRVAVVRSEKLVAEGTVREPRGRGTSAV